MPGSTGDSASRCCYHQCVPAAGRRVGDVAYTSRLRRAPLIATRIKAAVRMRRSSGPLEDRRQRRIHRGRRARTGTGPPALDGGTRGRLWGRGRRRPADKALVERRPRNRRCRRQGTPVARDRLRGQLDERSGRAAGPGGLRGRSCRGVGPPNRRSLTAPLAQVMTLAGWSRRGRFGRVRGGQGQRAFGVPILVTRVSDRGPAPSRPRELCQAAVPSLRSRASSSPMSWIATTSGETAGHRARLDLENGRAALESAAHSLRRNL